MPNYSTSRLERQFLQDQADLQVIPGGNLTTPAPASVAAADACRFVQMRLDNEVALLSRPDKTGTRSVQGMVGGRQFGRWSAEWGLVTSGVAGTEPDVGPVLKALFGQAPTIGAGTPAIVSSTNATPIVVTVTGHGLATGDAVNISGHATNTNANGIWLVKVIDTNSFSLYGSTGNGVGGATGTVSKVAVRYKLSDDILPFTMWSFRTPSTLEQRCAFGCVVQEATFNLGQDVATFSASGECVWVLESGFYSSASALQKGGISAFPTEPASPVTAGTMIPGFTGLAVLKDNKIATIRTATVRIQTQNQLVKDTFGSYLPNLSEGGERNVSVSFSVYDDDSTAVKDLKAASFNKTAIDIVLQVGTVAGNVVFLYLRNVFLSSFTLDDGQLRFVANFGDSRASATSLSVLDEVTLVQI